MGRLTKMHTVISNLLGSTFALGLIVAGIDCSDGFGTSGWLTSISHSCVSTDLPPPPPIADSAPTVGVDQSKLLAYRGTRIASIAHFQWVTVQNPEGSYTRAFGEHCSVDADDVVALVGTDDTGMALVEIVGKDRDGVGATCSLRTLFWMKYEDFEGSTAANQRRMAAAEAEKARVQAVLQAAGR